MATSHGWFGEQQCVNVRVLTPDISLAPDLAPSEILSYVGCTSRFHVRARDCSRAGGLDSACLGYYPVAIRANGSLPEGAVLHRLRQSPAGQPAESEQMVEWIPVRGSEGYVVRACFTAGLACPSLQKCRLRALELREE